MTRLAASVLWLAGGLGAGCMLCPWLAKEAEARECQGSLIDDLDGKDYRLTRIAAGAIQIRSLTLRIQPDDCSVAPPQDLSALGVVGLQIKNPRSASSASLVIQASLPGQPRRQVNCSAPLVEFEALEFVCPPEAGDLRFVLEPID